MWVARTAAFSGVWNIFCGQNLTSKGDPKIHGYGSGQVYSPHFVPGAKEDELKNIRVWDLAKRAGYLPILLLVHFSLGAKGGLSRRPAFHTGCPLLLWILAVWLLVPSSSLCSLGGLPPMVASASCGDPRDQSLAHTCAPRSRLFTCVLNHFGATHVHICNPTSHFLSPAPQKPQVLLPPAP